MLTDNSFEFAAKLFAEYAENSDDILWVADIETHELLYVNPACEKHWKIKPNRLSHPLFLCITIIHPDDSEKTLKLFNNAIAKQCNDKIEYRILVDDKEIWVCDKLTFLSCENKKYLLGITRDITEEKTRENFLTIFSHRLEKELSCREEAQRALDVQYKNNQQLIDMAIDGIVVIGSDNVILNCNPAYAKMHGYNKVDLIGQSVLKITASSQYINDEKYRRCLKEKGNIVTTGIHVCVDGKEIPIEMVANTLQYDNQLAIVAMVRDISERNTIEKERLELQKKLLQAKNFEALGKLAGGVAHDFNNILMNVGGYVQILKRKTPSSEYKKHEWLEKIIQASEHAKQLTKQLLLFANPHGAQQQYINVNDIIAEACHILEHARNKKAYIEKELSEELWAIQGDKSKLMQVLLNLGLNAKDAIAEKGHIHFSSKNITLESPHKKLAAGRYITVDVKDDGEGIPDSVREKIYDPFFTTKGVGEGTGLGLSTVFGVVEAHQGLIEVESQQNSGTTFRIYLPAQ